MNEELEMNQEKIVEMNRYFRQTVCQELGEFATITDKQGAHLPKHRSRTHQAFDVADKLRDLEAEVACQILDELIANFTEVQDYIVENYIHLLTEEE